MTDARALPVIDARAVRGIAGRDLVTPTVDRRHRHEASCKGAARTHSRRFSHRLGEVMKGQPQVTPEVGDLQSDDKSDPLWAPRGSLGCSMWHGVLLFSPQGRATGAISQQRRFRRAPSPSCSSVPRAFRLSNVGPGRADLPAARVTPEDSDHTRSLGAGAIGKESVKVTGLLLSLASDRSGSVDSARGSVSRAVRWAGELTW